MQQNKYCETPRKGTSLNGKWCFCTDSTAGEPEKATFRFPENAGSMTVPGCWNFEPGLFGYFGKAWYRTSFESHKPHLAIEFEGVSGRAEVYLDGKLIAEHYGGWTAFWAKSDAKPGLHTLTVLVDPTENMTDTIPLASVDWYNYAGITRDVTLFEFEGDYVENLRVDTDLSDELSTGRLSVSFSPCLVTDKTELPVTVTLENETVFSGVLPVEENRIQVPEICVKSPRLWDIGQPELYTLCVATEFDRVSEKIGFRKIETQDNRIFLNNKPIVFKGINRHEEKFDCGFTLTEEQMEEDLSRIKELGCNIVRGSHYPQNKRFVKMLDEAGIMLWSEIPLWGWDYNDSTLKSPLLQERYFTMHREMLSQYRNHPCITVWGLHNEIDTRSQTVYDLTEKIHRFYKAEDPGRLLTFATDKFPDDICLSFCDFISMNYYFGWYKGTIADWDDFIAFCHTIASEKKVGDKPLVMSEFGCAALYGFHDIGNGRWTEEYQSELISRVITDCNNNDFFAGTFVWQFADIRSERDLTRARNFNNKGILDERRRPKAAFYAVKDLYTKE